jgi:hypothetical protein
MNSKDAELPKNEIARRMDSAVRRALATPPTPAKALIGKTERAKSQRESREVRKRGKAP